jgi:AraC family L-rhamnose operon transcriptional activator RhaR/AraC family L-rhamnose operon regulatory protein RhaS
MDNIKFSGMLRYSDLGFSLHHDTLAQDNLLHTHDFHEMEIILSGSAVNSINGKSFPIGPGDVFIVGKGATHEITQVDRLELYNLGFRSQAMRGIGNDLLKLPGFRALFLMDQPTDPMSHRLKLDSVQLKTVRQLLDEMYEEYCRNLPGCQTVLLSEFTRLAVLLSRNYSRDIPEKSLWQMASVVAEMEQHYAEPISIADLAESAYLSERHLRRQFEAVYQQSPKAYLQNIRLNAAMQQLRQENLSITDIALACGFSDCNHFSRVFRQRFGISPTEYRKRYFSI